MASKIYGCHVTKIIKEHETPSSHHADKAKNYALYSLPADEGEIYLYNPSIRDLIYVAPLAQMRFTRTFSASVFKMLKV